MFSRDYSRFYWYCFSRFRNSGNRSCCGQSSYKPIVTDNRMPVIILCA